MMDVCLLLEGSYPFVAGGVATWVHQLISSMKDIKFGIVSITPSADPTRAPKYEMPGHVVYFKEICLHDYNLPSKPGRSPKKKDWQIVFDFYSGLMTSDFSRFKEFISLFQGSSSSLNVSNFFSSKEIWENLVYFYDKVAPDVSFIDFFWTWRATHLPLLNILSQELPQASIYHSISTGYAGLLGALTKEMMGGKFFLTEHGIYTHERMLEISQASWIFEQQRRHFRAERDLPFFKQWWIRIFTVMSSLAYHQADRIFTLYEGNKLREIADGASAEKIQIIPNGINLSEFSSIPKNERAGPQIALIGRVVSIKDIKTFIQAAKRVLLKYPDACFYIVGPLDEEETYADECISLVEALGLDKKVIFTGREDVKKYYSFLDLVVLTSLSEAQPYVIIEANCVGIPVVATDVGACRELLEGTTLPDKKIGPSGLLVEVANFEQTADAIINLISDKDMYVQMAEAGRKRVRLYYDQDDLLSRYLNVYEQNM